MMTADILIAPRSTRVAEPTAAPQNWPLYWASAVTPYIGRRVVEIGAGASPAAQHLNRNAESWICVEPDRRVARELAARARRGAFGPRCAVLNGWVVDLPPAKSCDTILYINTLEHIPADRAELEAAGKRLRRGGHLIVLSEAHPLLYSTHDAAVGRVRRYTRRSLIAIEPAGFHLAACSYLDSAGLLAAMAECCVPMNPTPSPQRIAFHDAALVPLSRRLDRLIGYRFGLSLLAVWRRVV
jgi:SAM-dependent methyltransferase